ncbi:MAG: hypothetical protein JWO37_1116 [Acidimicrobiales bacterium]|jgi:hypothetical protein|nr:hypothetical protein [Acidimicrobiales bacterium]
MGISRRGIAAVAMAGSMLAGGAVGATVFSAAPSVADTTPTTTASSGTSNSSTAAAPSPGTFKSNEDATHEAGESAAREAQENAGQVPTVP